MKGFVFVLVLILSTTQFSYGQYDKDEIEVEQAFGGNKYSVDGKSISIKQMKTLMRYDEPAYAQLKSGKAYSTTATVLGATGGVLIGLNVGIALANSADNTNGSKNETKWYLAATGGALVLISIPISITGNKRINNAIKIYNANLTSQSFQKPKPVYRFGFTGNGFGLIIKI